MTRRAPSLALLVALAWGPVPAAVSAADLPVPVLDGRRRRLDHPGRQQRRLARERRTAELVVDRDEHDREQPLPAAPGRRPAARRAQPLGERCEGRRSERADAVRWSAIEPDRLSDRPHRRQRRVHRHRGADDVRGQLPRPLRRGHGDHHEPVARTRSTSSASRDVYQLWDLFDGTSSPRFIWATAGICQSLLANPTSTQQPMSPVEPRCGSGTSTSTPSSPRSAPLYARCRFDNNAAFNTLFTTADVSGDYFHPSVAGQAKLASVTWAAGFTWTTTPPPSNAAPLASFTSSCSALSCSFTDTSTDGDGSITGRQWSFGDGTGSTATNPSRTYPPAARTPFRLRSLTTTARPHRPHVCDGDRPRRRRRCGR